MSAAKTESRKVALVATALRTLEGEGFEVRRPIPERRFESVGPFIMLDQFGPTDYAPGAAKGAPEHPHYGFETLTYLLEGHGLHRDSLGNVSITGPGEAQWMRAGRGIVHDEGPDEELRNKGGRMHGIQFWINLPRDQRRADPAYRPLTSKDIPELHRDGAVIRLLAGKLDGVEGPVSTFAAPWLAHITLPAGGKLDLTLPQGIELAAYALIGAAKAGPEGIDFAEGQIALFAPQGERVELAANATADILLLGGDRLDSPIFRYGPFVASSKGELLQAVQDYQLGRMGKIDFSQPAAKRRQEAAAQ